MYNVRIPDQEESLGHESFGSARRAVDEFEDAVRSRRLGCALFFFDRPYTLGVSKHVFERNTSHGFKGKPSSFYLLSMMTSLYFGGPLICVLFFRRFEELAAPGWVPRTLQGGGSIKPRLNPRIQTSSPCDLLVFRSRFIFGPRR